MTRTNLLDREVGQAMSAVSAAAKKGFGDPALADAAQHFDDSELAHLTGLIVAINNWNRVMVTRRIAPGGYTP
ncbi:hypothetical protein AB5J49_29565 [Streptomyces sp. R28]|uniref:Alkylhydroperoxidase n=1 Tax=Streptomyces sp. R28 TaxID=3238628 RepID=A0AB39Q1Z2_9ACTN